MTGILALSIQPSGLTSLCQLSSPCIFLWVTVTLLLCGISERLLLLHFQRDIALVVPLCPKNWAKFLKLWKRDSPWWVIIHVHKKKNKTRPFTDKNLKMHLFVQQPASLFFFLLTSCCEGAPITCSHFSLAFRVYQ